jgi:hypothetical protein
MKEERWNAEFVRWGQSGAYTTTRSLFMDSPRKAVDRLVKDDDAPDSAIAIIASNGEDIQIFVKQEVPRPKYEWVEKK